MKRAHRSLLAVGTKRNAYTVHFANGSIKKLHLEWHGGHLFSVVGSKTVHSLQRHRKLLRGGDSALDEPSSPKVHMSRYTSSNPDQILMVRHSMSQNAGHRRSNMLAGNRHRAGNASMSISVGGTALSSGGIKSGDAVRLQDALGDAILVFVVIIVEDNVRFFC